MISTTQILSWKTFLAFVLIVEKGEATLPFSRSVIDENFELESDPVPLSFIEAFQLLHQSSSDKESSRMISITNGGVYRGDLMVYLPITILLPTLAFGSRYSSWSKGRPWYEGLFGRSFSTKDSHHNENDIRGRMDRTHNGLAYDPYHKDYQSHLKFGPLLSRLDVYFHYLGVHDEECRKKLICQLVKDAAQYVPVSQVFMAALRKMESYERPKTFMRPVFRLYKYYWAAEEGASEGGNCDGKYKECPADADDVINLDILRLWQKISSYLSIKLSDE